MQSLGQACFWLCLGYEKAVSSNYLERGERSLKLVYFEADRVHYLTLGFALQANCQ